MPTVLILGAGQNLGAATAAAFADAGYTVAVASRTRTLDPRFPHFVFDGTRPETVPAVFEAVAKAVGVPSVVIYNLYATEVDAADPFSADLPALQRYMNANAVSAYAAAREAVRGFERGGGQGTFIFTGNATNEMAGPGFLNFGMGKSAAAHMVQNLALVAYRDRPYTFYYADEREDDGRPMYKGIGGQAHAETYLELAQDPVQRPWKYTFVAGKGYKKFPVKEIMFD
ncbi:putative short chain type dehydrogenase [Xylariomycetidae sp. FL0641]|nr:putative short chain type dehydrogenase [Xylariomycetidae sp. FL0641]